MRWRSIGSWERCPERCGSSLSVGPALYAAFMASASVSVEFSLRLSMATLRKQGGPMRIRKVAVLLSIQCRPLHHRRFCQSSALFHVYVGIGRFLHDCMHRGVERIGFLLAASPHADVLSSTLPMRDRSGKSAPVDHPSTYTCVDFPRYRTEDIE